jgi:hypothetical protein
MHGLIFLIAWAMFLGLMFVLHTLRRRANDLEFSRWGFFPGGIFTMRRNTSFNVPQIPLSACLRPVPQVAYPEGTLASDRLVALSSRCKGHE